MIYHKELAKGRWKEFSFLKQMANAGSEVERAIDLKNKKDEKGAMIAFERAIELIDLTIMDEKNIKHIREIARVREVLTDYFMCGNNYYFSDKAWKDYFYLFAAALSR